MIQEKEECGVADRVDVCIVEVRLLALPNLMLDLCAVAHNLRVSLDNLLLHPTLNECTAVRCINKTDRNVECLLQLLTEAVTYS